MGVLPHLSHVFNEKDRYCLYICSEYLCSSPRVLHQNTSRFAPKCLAFCTKMPRVLHQNALRLAPKCTAFSTKMHRI